VSAPTPLLAQVEHLTKRFRQGEVTVEALRDVSLDVAAGDFVAVMGASGSGKSTLLHLMAGLTRPDVGRVMIAGEVLSEMPEPRLTLFRRRRIGLVFQAFNLIPTLTAEENILLPALADGRKGLEPQALDRLLARLDLAERRLHRPDALSGGEQQRVAIARALAMDPALILADEPTGSLDSVSGQDLCQLLHGLNREQGCTIMLVTHEPAVAVWAKRVVVLRDGGILAAFNTAGLSDAQALARRYQEAVAAPTAGEARA
jgi:putative ABC transport system ATP-binding protein